MCEPTSIIAGISAISGLYQTRKNAKNQESAINKASAQRDTEIRQSNSIKANDRNLRARRRRAQLKAGSAESGLSGGSITDILNNEMFQAGQDVSHINLDTRNSRNSNQVNTQTQLNRIEQPNYLATGLQIADLVNSSQSKPGG